MTRLKLLLALIAASQFVLASLVIALPGPFFAWMGLSVPATDNGYMLAMLGARFLASGIGMTMLARAERPERFWILNMALIQAVDFLAGAAYLASGAITLATAAFPMTNAAIFTALLLLLVPADDKRDAKPVAA